MATVRYGGMRVQDRRAHWFCQAATARGQWCRRRVYDHGSRCYQHQGMDAYQPSIDYRTGKARRDQGTTLEECGCVVRYTCHACCSYGMCVEPQTHIRSGRWALTVQKRCRKHIEERRRTHERVTVENLPAGKRVYRPKRLKMIAEADAAGVKRWSELGEHQAHDGTFV